MSYTIVSEETGQEFHFKSLADYEAAEAWYNRTPGGVIQEFCKANGLDLFVSETELRPDWHDAAMELYASLH